MTRASLRTIACATLVALFAVPACGGSQTTDDGGRAELSRAGIEQLAFIRRASRTDVGDVFQYTSFSVTPRTANIMRLSTLSGGGDPEPITPFGTGDWPKADIMAMDVSFDGQEIVFSARLEGESTYDLYRIKIDGTNPEEPGQVGPALVHTGPYHSVFPIYLPNDQIFFMTNETTGPEVRQFRDEYERGVTAQAATISKRGGNMQLGPRNLSHRVSPTLVSLGDEGAGQILHTNWDHLTDVNEGNLMVMNPDMTGGAEFFGKEGSGVSNSYLKARQVNQDQFLAISTSRSRTFQSGAIILINRGENEATSSAEVLTPDVPRGNEPSWDKVGRYYDAYPVVDSNNKLKVLTSWADGPVQSDVAAGGVMGDNGIDYGEGSGPPDFGIYLLDPETNTRLPIYNDTEMWDVLPMAIGKSRTVPTSPAGAVADTPDGTALIGALNVHESSLAAAARSGVQRVRVIEGFSVEEGIPGDFGMTRADGAIVLGEAPVSEDGSFAAFVPEDRPLHLQTLDEFGMSLLNEDRWFSAAPGEQRFCGGCHEERNQTQVVDQGLPDAVARGPMNMALPHVERRLDDAYNQDYAAMTSKMIWPDDEAYADTPRLLGIPWDKAIQDALDRANCASCHDGTPGPANPSVTVSDAGMNPDLGEEAMSYTWTFNLSGEAAEFETGMMAGAYTSSYISLMMMGGLEGEEGIVVETDPEQPYQTYIVPESARDSILVRYLQPEQVYPTHNPDVVAFAGVEKPTGGVYETQHPNENTPGYDPERHRPLTEAEKYLFILMADLGGQYYSLENAPGYDSGSAQ